MSLWQHKNIHKKHLLWAKLFGICFVFHLIFLFWIFCIYHDNNYLLSIFIHKHLDYSNPILFVPCPIQKPTKTQSPIVAKKTPSSTTIIQSKPSATKVPPIEQKKTTTIPEVSKKIPESPKMEPIKTEPAKQEVKKQEEPKKDVPKLEQPVQKTELPQKIEPTNAHISHNHREAEVLRLSAQLQKELVQTWKPPLGVSPECMCEVSFFVNKTGIIENLKMIKSSGVIMYDISARQAICAMKMPQWTYGKPLVISFKQ